MSSDRVCVVCRVGRKGRLDCKSDRECQAARAEIDPSHARSLEHSKKHQCYSYLASELRLWLSVCLLFLLHVTSLHAVWTASDAGVAASPYIQASSLSSVCSSNISTTYGSHSETFRISECFTGGSPPSDYYSTIHASCFDLEQCEASLPYTDHNPTKFRDPSEQIEIPNSYKPYPQVILAVPIT